MKKLLLIVLLIVISISSISAVNPIKYCELESNFPVCADNNIYNGYWWNGFWVPGIPTQSTQMLANPPIAVGKAVFYGPGVMEGTARYRGFNLENYIDGVSLLTCGDIGKSIWIKRPGFDWEGPFLVVDCAKRGDLYGIINYRNEVVEVGFKTALKWKMAYYSDTEKWKYKEISWNIDNVTVSKFPPPMTGKLNKVSMRDWFNSVAEFSEETEDKNNCKLAYKFSKNDILPLWRINCKWITLY